MTRRELLHRPISWITLVLSALLLIAFGVAGWSFYNGHAEACAARNQTLRALRDIIVLAESTPNPHATPDQADRATKFYAKALHRIDKARCR